MPQREAKFQINSFTGGLVTDANPLADAGPVSIDEKNCEILFHGGRRRRRGASPESAYNTHSVTLTTAQKEDWAFASHDWLSVANVSGLDFVVFQQGDKLWFYDKSFNPLSAGIKSFSINLQTYKTPVATAAKVRNTRVSMATGKGVLFVCAPTIEPIYIEFDCATDSVTTTQITIEIRDFEEQSPSIGVQEQIVVPPATTGQHLYDLLNQGWYQQGLWVEISGSTNKSGDPVIVLYLGDTEHSNGTLPRKNTPWHVGRTIVIDGETSRNYIQPQQVVSFPSGTELAPLGHYILEAFNKDRAQAVRDENDLTTKHFLANLADLVAEVDTERPSNVAFYAGRAWYLKGNNLYYSQQLDEDSLERAGRCYQEGDPTNEGESDILATDGGVVPIPEMNNGLAFATLDNSLLVFAENGVWAVAGPGGGSFTAVDFGVSKITDTQCKSPYSVVNAEGSVFFWGEESIYVIQPGEVRDTPAIQDIAEQRITEFYKLIPQNSKRNALGLYDPRDKIVYWMYAENEDSAGSSTNRFKYDAFLNFSLKYSAFFPWQVTADSSNQIIGGTIAPGLGAQNVEEDVVDSSDVVVTDSSGADVTVFRITLQTITSQLKFQCLISDNATFGEFDDLSFLDWNQAGSGSDYSSYIETFYHLQDDFMAYMQAPYVYTAFKKTEEAPVAVAFPNLGITNINTGGMTFSPSVISTIGTDDHGESAHKQHPGSAYLIGEDGNRYALASEDADELRWYDIDTGLEIAALSIQQPKIDTDLAPFAPSGGGFVGTSTSIATFLVQGTPYFIVIGTQTEAGSDTSKGILYYRLNSSGAWEVAGGIGLRKDGLDVDASPPDAMNGAISGIGFVQSTPKTSLASGNSRAATHNTIPYQYPISVTYSGENGATVLVLPSINYMLNAASNTITESVADNVWNDKENLLSTDFDFEVFNVEGILSTANQIQRAFFLPNDTFGRIYIPFYLKDIEEHIAGSEATTSTYLQANDSANSTGLISSLEMAVVASAVEKFGFTTTFQNQTIADQTTFQWPFPDEEENFDTTAGVADENYYMPPACYPLVPTDIEQPWILFWPRLYRKSGDELNFGIRTTAWDPVTETHKLIDFKNGAVTAVSDTESGATPTAASIWWDRTDGSLIAEIRYAGVGKSWLVNVDFGTYLPDINGIDDPLTLMSAASTVVNESSCLLNTRWNWSNTTASNKISSDIQVYRGNQLQLVTDTNNPEATGLPVLVSKAKTRGRGRALQLRYRSETGKDFELYGWGVWSAKNARF